MISDKTTADGSQIFSIKPLSKTWHWLGLCRGWFHLYCISRAARSAKREIQNKKILPWAGHELMANVGSGDKYFVKVNTRFDNNEDKFFQ